MKVNYGNGKTKFGPGVSIELSGDEVCIWSLGACA